MYFAKKDAKDAAGVILGKCDFWFGLQNTSGLLWKIQASYRAYHGAYYDNLSSGHTVSFGGEQGEFAQIPVNHYRNIAQHMLVMTTSSRPAMDARATNTDYKSLVQTYLANGILDYYMREKRLEDYIKKAVELAIVMGAGYIKLEWNSTSGEVYEYEDDETGQPDQSKPIYEGDIEFNNLSPLDVVFDTTKENPNKHDWVVTRTFKNKYDLAAKYPELAKQIEQLSTKSDQMLLRFTASPFMEETDDIPVYEWYHKKTDALPEGRYLLFLTEDIVLYDGPMPYRDLPIIRVAPGDFLGSPYGYTSMFDLLPLQEAANSLYSTVLTNQSAFGVQNVYVPRGADISYSSLEGGLNIVEGNAQAGPPIPLNLTQTPKEIFEFLNIIVRDMETLSGVSSVTRGNPEASLKSGAALAMVQSLALQFSSSLQNAYIQCIENLGTQIIKLLQDFAVAKRAVTLISGKSNRTFVKEFNNDDLSNISRVVVDVGNPLARTTSGKLQMAESLLQYGAISDPQHYLTIINTGKLEVATEDLQKQLFLIQAENERLVSGGFVTALFTDSHAKHIAHHKDVLSDPELRQDPELVMRVTQHIQEHIILLETTEPNKLMLLGEQPLQPMMPPGGPQQAPGAPPATEPPQIGGLPEAISGPGIEGEIKLPNVPKPPAPFENLPTSPQGSS